MHRHRTAVLSAAAVAVALGSAGCTQHQAPAPSPPVATSSAAAAAPTGALPAPEALTDVLYRIADPAVPGTAKLGLVDGATPGDAGTLDRFATALKDSGYTPPTFAAHDIGWSDDRPADVVATIAVTKPGDSGDGGSFPMEFAPHQGGWQLARETFGMLLDFSNPPR